MDIFVLIVTVPVLVSMLSAAFRGGADSSTWELRWRGLAPADRARLSAAARSGAEIADPEEAELAAGFRRRRERRSAYFEAPAFLIIAVLTAMSLTGIGGGIAGSVLGAAVIVTGLWSYGGEKILDRASRASTSPDASL